MAWSRLDSIPDTPPPSNRTADQSLYIVDAVHSTPQQVSDAQRALTHLAARTDATVTDTREVWAALGIDHRTGVA